MDQLNQFDASFLIGTLNLLCQSNKTGILTATSQGEQVTICIQEGAVVYVSGSNKTSRLGHLLETEGLITKTQLNACLKRAQTHRQSLGKTLIENNCIPLKVLKDMLSKQAELIIFNMFLWEKGHFEYRDVRLKLKGLIITHINIIKLLLKATQIINNISMFKKLIKNDNVVFQTKPLISEQISELNAKERKILALIDGHRTVTAIVDQSGFFKIKVYSILYTLFSSGRIDPVDSD